MPDPYAPHILFAGGGTEGRLTPGLAVAHRIQNESPHATLSFFGHGNAAEQRRVERAGFRYLTGPCESPPRRFWQLPGYWAKARAARKASRELLRQEGVHVVVGLGGHASVPVAQAARQLALPVVILEQNVVLGAANRRLARRATVICTSFAETQHYLSPHLPTRWTGTPVPAGAVRRLLLEQHRPNGEGPKRSPWSEADAPAPVRVPPQLLIVASSGGSQPMNACVAKALFRVRARLIGWRVIHQTGAADLVETKKYYRKHKMSVTSAPLLSNAPAMLAQSELAITRAGGAVLAEVAAAAVPAILMPLPTSSMDHQRRNADVFAAAGAAIVVDQRQADSSVEQQLADALWRLLGDAEARRAMADAVRRLARPDATTHVAALIHSLTAPS